MTREMKLLFLALILCILGYIGEVRAAEICWQNPSENEDGTALNDLVKITLYAGPTSGGDYDRFVDVETMEPGGEVCYVWALPVGTWYVVGTATDTLGNESVWSNEVEKIEDGGPVHPTIVTDPFQEGGVTENARVFIGVTGKPVTIRLTSRPYRMWVMEYGLEVPDENDDSYAHFFASQGTYAEDAEGWTWTYVPPQAGMYYIQTRQSAGDPWVRSMDQENGVLFYYTLAAPTDGGIE